MYLSRLLLNPRSRQVQRELANPYEMHRTILTAFPPTLSKDERVLFRVEEHPHSGTLTLLVQSLHPPDWSPLTHPGKAYLLHPDTVPDGLYNPAVKPFNPALSSGQTLTFRLRANPTKRLSKNAEKGAGKRVGLYREEEQLAWLRRKLESAGCSLISARTAQQDNVTGRLHREERKHDLRFLSVQFEGLLKIQNPDRLLTALQNGLGTAKGLGFGLLSLAPARG